MLRKPGFHLLLALTLSFVACESTKPATNKPEQAAPPITQRSPLGIEYPNPLVVVRRVMGNMESGQWEATCEDLADLGRNGRPVPLVPGENVPKDLDPGVKDKIKPFFRHFRGVNAPWVKISYGRVETVRNDPPTVRVPVQWNYDLERISARDREVLIHAYAKQVSGKVTWADVVTRMRAEVETHRRNRSWPTWTFSWLRDRWRLYIGRPLK